MIYNTRISAWRIQDIFFMMFDRDPDVASVLTVGSYLQGWDGASIIARLILLC